MSTQFEQRPLLIALAALSIGIACRWELAVLLLLIPLVAFVRSTRSWALTLLCLVAGYFVSPIPSPTLKSPSYELGPARVLTEGEDRLDAVESVVEVGSYRLLLSAPVGSHLHPGELVKGPFKIAAVSEDQESFDLKQGIQGKTRTSQLVLLNEPLAIFRFSDAIKDDFRAFVYSSAPSDSAAWIQSLWLRGGSLSKEDRDRLAVSGAYSLVSASGLNVFVLWGCLTFLLGSLLHLDRRIQIGLIALTLAGYCLVSGLHESTLRASLGCIVLSTAYLFRREPDLVSVTALFGIIYLLFFPRAVSGLGFQLSMMVPMAIGFYLPTLRSLMEERRVGQLAAITLIVFLSSEPLIAYHTGRFGFGTFATSSSIALAAPFALGSVLIAYVLKFFLPLAAIGLMHGFVIPLVQGLQTTVSWIAGAVPSFAVPSFSAVWLFVYFGFWIVLWRQREVAA